MRPGDHGFLAAVLRPGMRAATVAVDAVSGTAGLIWPGDHVDLILTQDINDPHLPPARRVSAVVVLSDVRVIAIDQDLVHGATPGVVEAHQARTVTLEATDDQTARVAVAVRLGHLSLAVRSATPLLAEGLAQTPGAGRVTVWAGDVSPALAERAAAIGQSATLRIFGGSAEAKEFHF
jgi:pilus assembly protein CpaB